MISCDPQYYSGCILLYGVLSISDRTLESVDFKKIVTDREPEEFFLHPFESVTNLAKFLFEEIFSYSDSAGSDIGSTEVVVVNWSDRIQEWVHTGGESLGMDIGLYYFVLIWWIRTLGEFDHLMSSIQSESAQERYRAAIDLCQDLKIAAQQASATIESRENIDAEEMKRFRRSVTELVDQLADEWNQEVERMSHLDFSQ